MQQTHSSEDSHNESAGIAINNTRKPPAKRGYTKMRKIAKMADGKQRHVYVNGYNQFNGQDATTFANYLGTLVRNGVEVPLKESTMGIVKDNYNQNDIRVEDDASSAASHQINTSKDLTRYRICLIVRKCVVEGFIILDDSDQLVGRHKLGTQYVGIFVDKVIDPDEPLIRPYETYDVMHQIDGKCIAWPKSLLKKI